VSGSDFERAFHSYSVLFYIVFQSFSLFFIVFHCFYSQKWEKGGTISGMSVKQGEKTKGKIKGNVNKGEKKTGIKDE
jgi:hypothetical protein